jgi:hypothetical protein
MMLFMPHRTFDDLVLDGSHQKRFQRAIKDKEISPEMIEIANNTQNIHNSLKSSMPQNQLALNTEFIDPENFELDGDETDEEDDISTLRLLELMQDAFGDEGTNTNLSEDSEVINPIHEKKSQQLFDHLQNEAKSDNETDTSMEATSVIEFALDNSAKPPGKAKGKPYNDERFHTKRSTLNTLAMKQTQVTNNNGVQQDSNPGKIICNGTWSSIVLWGIQAGLDKNQQVAYEILTATFVLTFYEDAEDCNIQVFTDFSLECNEQNLTLLTRKNPKTPLRFFITGPAGAGKCESKQTKC